MPVDPFNSVAGVVGMLGVAAHGMHVLWNEIESTQGAPDEIKSLKSELQVVEAVIRSLEGQISNRAEQKPGLERSITICLSACERFGGQLSKWTKHSDNGTVQFRDSVTFALFGQKRVDTLWKQLQSCKSTVTMATSDAILLAVSSDEVNLREREIERAQAIIHIDGQVEEQNELMVMEQSAVQEQLEVNKIDEELQAARAALREETQFLVSQLRASRNAYAASIKALHSARTGQNISAIDMGEGSKLLVGLINVSESAGLGQDISNVKTGKNSQGIVGKAQNVNLDNFFS